MPCSRSTPTSRRPPREANPANPDLWPPSACSAPWPSAARHEQRAGAGPARPSAAVRSRSGDRRGTSSCSTSRPRPATSRRPSTPPTSWRSCTRRSTTRSSSIDHSGDAVPRRLTSRAWRLGRGRRRRRRARHAREARTPPAGRDRPAVRDAARPAARASAAAPRASASAQQVAAQLLARRAGRRLGRGARARSCRARTPGDYQLTPPALRAAGVHPLALVRPFVAAPRQPVPARVRRRR